MPDYAEHWIGPDFEGYPGQDWVCPVCETKAKVTVDTLSILHLLEHITIHLIEKDRRVEVGWEEKSGEVISDE